MGVAIEVDRHGGWVGRTVKDLIGWLTWRPVARPGDVVIGHSSTLRSTVFLLVGVEVLVEGMMDMSVIPPALRPFHYLWMALMIDLSTIFAALTKRNPHRLTSGALHIRAGLYDEIAVPLNTIRAVRREMLSAKGRGVRQVPDRDGDVMCTVAGSAEIALDLIEPMDLRLANGSQLTARRLYLAADAPGIAHRELAHAVRRASSG
ncbi:hypothetical protein [Streptomyces silvisoli]|uniref:Uncharacterized protein n=1 Tax=Streptomyces silvisoli TaxID=3034235 RepID=A0ABT5ZFL0_9ACTN|nr:hypothetical protein [Streptomyces silvisoli]MDF3288369.1 hypothetical protein [Streptomyces silvisoli]